MNEIEIKRPVWGPVCDLCDQRLEEPGSLLFGPPDTEGRCLKTHICVRCSRSTPVGVHVPEGEPHLEATPDVDETDTVCIPGSLFRDMHAAYVKDAATPPVTPQVGAGGADARVEGDEALAALARAKEGTWRPMSEAPKGKRVLVHDRRWGVTDGFQYDDGWKTFGNCGVMPCEPLAWREHPAPPAPQVEGAER